MILTLRNQQRLSKLNATSTTTSNRLLDGEKLLIQTLDNRLILTTHRIIQKYRPWDFRTDKSVMLEDIKEWQIKVTGNNLYLGLSIISALFVYFSDSFALISCFFLTLYIMTRHRRVFLIAQGAEMMLPAEVEEARINSLEEMVRSAKKARLEKLRMQEVMVA